MLNIFTIDGSFTQIHFYIYIFVIRKIKESLWWVGWAWLERWVLLPTPTYPIWINLEVQTQGEPYPPIPQSLCCFCAAVSCFFAGQIHTCPLKPTEVGDNHAPRSQGRDGRGLPSKSPETVLSLPPSSSLSSLFTSLPLPFFSFLSFVSMHFLSSGKEKHFPWLWL